MPPQVAALVNSFTWLDWAVIAVVAAFVLDGYRRGLIFGVLDLFSAVAGYAIAALGYAPLSAEIVRRTSVPAPLAVVAAFLVLLLLGQQVYGFLVNALARLAPPLPRVLGPIQRTEKALGILPGALKGAAALGAVLVPLVVLPLAPALSRTILEAPVAGRLVSLWVNDAPRLWSSMPYLKDLRGPTLDLITPADGPVERLPPGPLGPVVPRLDARPLPGDGDSPAPS